MCLTGPKTRIGHGGLYINYAATEDLSGSFFPIVRNSRREISNGSPAIRGVGDMFARKSYIPGFNSIPWDCRSPRGTRFAETACRD